MEPRKDPEVRARVEMAMELYELSERMMRQNIRRRHPELDDDEVEERLVEWLMRRPPMGEGFVARPVEAESLQGSITDHHPDRPRPENEPDVNSAAQAMAVSKSCGPSARGKTPTRNPPGRR